METSAERARWQQRPVAPRRRKLRERVSLGHLFMIGAALLAFVLVVSVLQDRTRTVKVLAARSEINPGATITPDQVTEIELPANSKLVSSMATRSSLGAGATAAQHLQAGDPISLTALAPRTNGDGLRAMSIPIDRSRAVGGDLIAGDRVDVISVSGNQAIYVAVDLEVLRTQTSQSNAGALSSSALTDYYVTVAVNDQTALAVALAQQTGKVSILRATGATPVPAQRQAFSDAATPGGAGSTAAPGSTATSSVPGSTGSATPSGNPTSGVGNGATTSSTRTGSGNG